MSASLSSDTLNLSDDCAAPDNIDTTCSKIYQDISVVKQLTHGRFPVYLIRSKIIDQTFAMKVFPYEEGKPNTCYLNEIRFLPLNHPNVIQTHYLEHEKKTKSKGVISTVSYKVMEYAPYDNLYDFMIKNSHSIDDKLIRTYFKQLIDGLEYLHNNGVSHMDIKLENLLIGNEFALKITDFDLSHCKDDSKVVSKGTKLYRSPEIIEGNCKNTNAADIYSAGIVLFTLKTRGVLPHAENHMVNGINFFELLNSNPRQFWIEHCEIQRKEDSFFDEEFKELFVGMTKAKVEERWTIEDIKKSRWYNEPVYSEEEFKSKLRRIFWN